MCAAFRQECLLAHNHRVGCLAQCILLIQSSGGTRADPCTMRTALPPQRLFTIRHHRHGTDRSHLGSGARHSRWLIAHVFGEQHRPKTPSPQRCAASWRSGPGCPHVPLSAGREYAPDGPDHDGSHRHALARRGDLIAATTMYPSPVLAV